MLSDTKTAHTAKIYLQKRWIETPARCVEVPSSKLELHWIMFRQLYCFRAIPSYYQNWFAISSLLQELITQECHLSFLPRSYGYGCTRLPQSLGYMRCPNQLGCFQQGGWVRNGRWIGLGEVLHQALSPGVVTFFCSYATGENSSTPCISLSFCPLQCFICCLSISTSLMNKK